MVLYYPRCSDFFSHSAGDGLCGQGEHLRTDRGPHKSMRAWDCCRIRCIHALCSLDCVYWIIFHFLQAHAPACRSTLNLVLLFLIMCVLLPPFCEYKLETWKILIYIYSLEFLYLLYLVFNAYFLMCINYIGYCIYILYVQ